MLCKCIVSLWEVAIKYSLSKLQLKTDLSTIFNLIKDSRLNILPITTQHVLTSANLDFHHRDPFDRLIIGQAQAEDLTLLSKDGEFEQYEIKLLCK